MSSKKELMRCDDCGKEKEDAEETFCPLQLEINDDRVPCVLCNDCYRERCADI